MNKPLGLAGLMRRVKQLFSCVYVCSISLQYCFCLFSHPPHSLSIKVLVRAGQVVFTSNGSVGQEVKRRAPQVPFLVVSMLRFS